MTDIELNEGLEQIYDGAFAECESLKEIRIPSTVGKIESEVFRDCVQLMHVHFVDGQFKIESKAFRGCTSLPQINIPCTVMSIHPVLLRAVRA